MGDYVDRGQMSIEVMTLLFTLKVKYPTHITLIRGNHESRTTTSIYGFHTECNTKFADARIYHAFMKTFDYLPLGTVIDGAHFSLHGGLSPRCHTLDQLRILDRFMEIPSEGVFSDIVWSDPDPTVSGFHLSPRGAGYIFGSDVVEKFIHGNALVHISRAHQLCMEGYQTLFRDTLSTVWSAPNYCFRFGNLASVMVVDENLSRKYNVFTAANEKEETPNAIYGTLPTESNLQNNAGYFT